MQPGREALHLDVHVDDAARVLRQVERPDRRARGIDERPARVARSLRAGRDDGRERTAKARSPRTGRTLGERTGVDGIVSVLPVSVVRYNVTRYIVTRDIRPTIDGCQAARARQDGRYNPRDDRDPTLGPRRRRPRPVRTAAASRRSRALPEALPTVAELFDFMRDAELRFETLRLRIEERTQTARGEDVVDDGRRAAPSGRGEGHDDAARRDAARPEYEVWISDGEIVRTYSSAHRLGTQRPVRNRPRGLDDPDLPGHVEGLRAGHGAADGDPARHVRPPGRLLPERPRDRPLHGHRHRRRRRARGDPPRVRPSADDRARRRPARLPHLDRGRPRDRASSSDSSNRSAAR